MMTFSWKLINNSMIFFSRNEESIIQLREVARQKQKSTRHRARYANNSVKLAKGSSSVMVSAF